MVRQRRVGEEPKSMLKLFTYIAALLAAVIATKILAEKYLPARNRLYSYYHKQSLVSQAESGLFDVLLSLVESQYHIFPHVHLLALLNHNLMGQNWR